MRFFFTMSAVAVAMLSAQPLRATEFAAVYSGIVSSGTDHRGLFGAADSDLAGKTFTLTFVYTDPLGPGFDFNVDDPSLYYFGGGFFGMSSFLSATLKVEEIAFSIASDFHNTFGRYNDTDSQLPGDAFDYSYHSVAGKVGNCDAVTRCTNASALVRSYEGDIVRTSNIYEPISYAVRPGDLQQGNFDIWDYQPQWDAYSSLARGTLQVQRLDAFALPEPATWMSLLFGFLSLGWIVRRRNAAPKTCGRGRGTPGVVGNLFPD